MGNLVLVISIFSIELLPAAIPKVLSVSPPLFRKIKLTIEVEVLTDTNPVPGLESIIPPAAHPAAGPGQDCVRAAHHALPGQRRPHRLVLDRHRGPVPPGLPDHAGLLHGDRVVRRPPRQDARTAQAARRVGEHARDRHRG